MSPTAHHETIDYLFPRFSVDSGCGFAALPQHSLQRSEKSVGPLTAAENWRHSGIFRKVGTAIDRRHREIELGPFRASGQRHPDRVEQRFRLLARAGLDLIRNRPEALPIQP